MEKKKLKAAAFRGNKDMLQNQSLTQIAKATAWFVFLTGLSLVLFVVIFLLTVSFLGPVLRFILIFLLTVGLNYVLVKPFKFSPGTRYFLAIAPAVIATVAFLFLGVMQQSNFQCSEFTQCVYFMGSRVCNPVLDWTIRLVCSF